MPEKLKIDFPISDPKQKTEKGGIEVSAISSEKEKKESITLLLVFAECGKEMKGHGFLSPVLPGQEV